jgi:hypothetical protein
MAKITFTKTAFVLSFLNCSQEEKLENIIAGITSQYNTLRPGELLNHSLFVSYSNCHLFELVETKRIESASQWRSEPFLGLISGKKPILLTSLSEPKWVETQLWEEDPFCVLLLAQINPLYFLENTPLDARIKYAEFCKQQVNAPSYCNAFFPLNTDSLVLALTGQELEPLLRTAYDLADAASEADPTKPLLVHAQIIPGIRATNINKQSTGTKLTLFQQKCHLVLEAIATRSHCPDCSSELEHSSVASGIGRRFTCQANCIGHTVDFLIQTHTEGSYIVGIDIREFSDRKQKVHGNQHLCSSLSPPIELKGLLLPKIKIPQLDSALLEIAGAHLQCVELRNLFGRVQAGINSPLEWFRFIDLVAPIQELSDVYVIPWIQMVTSEDWIENGDGSLELKEVLEYYARQWGDTRPLIIGPEGMARRRMLLITVRRYFETLIQGSCHVLRNAIAEREVTIFLEAPSSLHDCHWINETSRKAASMICTSVLDFLGKTEYRKEGDPWVFWPGCVTVGARDAFYFFPPQIVNIPAASELNIVALTSLSHESAHINYGTNCYGDEMPPFILDYGQAIGSRKEEEEIYAEIMSLYILYDGNPASYSRRLLEHLSAHLEFGEKLLIRHPSDQEQSESIIPAYTWDVSIVEKYHKTYLGRFLAVIFFTILVKEQKALKGLVVKQWLESPAGIQAIKECLKQAEQNITLFGNRCIFAKEWKRILKDLSQTLETYNYHFANIEDNKINWITALVSCVLLVFENLVAKKHSYLLAGRWPMPKPNENVTQTWSKAMEQFSSSTLETDIDIDPTEILNYISRWANTKSPTSSQPQTTPFDLGVIMSILFSFANIHDSIQMKQYSK